MVNYLASDLGYEAWLNQIMETSILAFVFRLLWKVRSYWTLILTLILVKFKVLQCSRKKIWEIFRRIQWKRIHYPKALAERPSQLCNVSQFIDVQEKGRRQHYPNKKHILTNAASVPGFSMKFISNKTI